MLRKLICIVLLLASLALLGAVAVCAWVAGVAFGLPALVLLAIVKQVIHGHGQRADTR